MCDARHICNTEAILSNQVEEPVAAGFQDERFVTERIGLTKNFKSRGIRWAWTAVGTIGDEEACFIASYAGVSDPGIRARPRPHFNTSLAVQPFQRARTTILTFAERGDHDV